MSEVRSRDAPSTTTTWRLVRSWPSTESRHAAIDLSSSLAGMRTVTRSSVAEDVTYEPNGGAGPRAGSSTRAAHHRPDGPEQDHDVVPEGPVLHVVIVEHGASLDRGVAAEPV